MSLHWVLKQNKFRIFMSATMNVLERYFRSTLITDHINFESSVLRGTRSDYSYLNLNFYHNYKAIENLLLNIPLNEKVLYFGSAKDSYELSLDYKGSSFICSKTNDKGYFKYSNEKTLDTIIQKEMFDERYLFTTKVLDNGINIKDIRQII